MTLQTLYEVCVAPYSHTAHACNGLGCHIWCSTSTITFVDYCMYKPMMLPMPVKLQSAKRCCMVQGVAAWKWSSTPAAYAAAAAGDDVMLGPKDPKQGSPNANMRGTNDLTYAVWRVEASDWACLGQPFISRAKRPPRQDRTRQTQQNVEPSTSVPA